MKKYNNQEFIDTVMKRIRKNAFPTCPYCGGNSFSTPEQFASIIAGNELPGINLGVSIPSGMVICKNCGHIEFFALGALGLLSKEGKTDGK